MVLLPLLSSAQSFVLTPNGFVNANDSTKKYVVVEMEGSQSELFKSAKTAVTMTWNSPKDVLSFNEPDIIVVNGIASDLLSIKKIVTVYYDVPYRIQMQFKDGKVRFDAPMADKGNNIERRSELYFCSGKGHGATFYFWNKKNELKQSKNKKILEDYINGLIDSLISKMKSNVKTEDW